MIDPDETLRCISPTIPAEEFSRKRRRPKYLRVILSFLCFAIGLIIGNLVTKATPGFNSLPKLSSFQEPTALYSPAQGAVRSRLRVFDGGFGLNSTPYSGYPSEANNKLWKQLYNFGVSRIEPDEARQMANKTLPIPGDDDHYIISLSVFHQLHCLNRIRLAIYEGVDWSDVDDSTGITHVDHCVNAIRQSLMCSADVTPLTFGRDPRDARAKEIMEVVHTCRDFEAVQQWGMERPLKGSFNFTGVVHHDPLGWGNYSLGPWLENQEI